MRAPVRSGHRGAKMAVALVAAAAVAAAAGAAAALPGPGPGPTIAFDRACYVAGEPGAVALAGFTPGAAVTVTVPGLGSAGVVADAHGTAVLPITPPDGSGLGGPGSAELVATATQDDSPAVVARATGRVAPRAFATAGGLQSPAARRTWALSGWPPGREVHAHFRFAGRTAGGLRLGVPAGPCGELRVNAPAIVAAGPVRPGVWTIQVDQRPAYSPLAAPALRDQTVVLTTFRPRAGRPGQSTGR